MWPTFHATPSNNSKSDKRTAPLASYHTEQEGPKQRGQIMTERELTDKLKSFTDSDLDGMTVAQLQDWQDASMRLKLNAVTSKIRKAIQRKKYQGQKPQATDPRGKVGEKAPKPHGQRPSKFDALRESVAETAAQAEPLPPTKQASGTAVQSGTKSEIVPQGLVFKSAQEILAQTFVE